jgi:iron(III) transport system ATP-binding protein
MEPKLLLLDEPLSNLDAKLRELMRFELKRLQRELRITTVYVTHDQSEALALSHQVAVMNQGRIQQIGSPRDIYERPQNQFVADFVGTTNFVDGVVIDKGMAADQYVIDTELGPLHSHSVETVRVGDKVVLSIRPEDVALSETAPQQTGVNAWQASVDQKVFLGEANDFQIKVGNRTLLSRTHPSVRTAVGQPIWARMEPSKCVAMPAAAELRRAA